MSQITLSSSVWSLLWTVICLCVLAYAVYLIYNAYFHPLAKFPGPTLAGVSRWYETFHDLRGPEGGQFMYKIKQMHKEYGPIVRIAPNELHIDDFKYREKLYSNSQKTDKVPYMIDIFGTPLAIFGTEKHELHRLRRSALNPFFSKQSIQRLEGVISGKALKMCGLLGSYSRETRTVNLRHVLTACIVDITTEFSERRHLAFAKCANALDGADFSPRWEAMMVGVSEAVPVARAFPAIVQILQSLPLWMLRQINPLVAKFAEFEQLVRHDVEEIFQQYARKSAPISKPDDREFNTIFHEILDSTLPDQEKTVDRMTQEALSVISAASETTSSTLSTIVFHVTRDQALEFRLTEELRTVMPTPESSVKWKELEKLPLLSAVIKEGLRLSAPVCGRLPLTSRDAIHYNEWIIPAGTYVGMSLGDALHHPQVYNEPYRFDPDRWLHTPSSSTDSAAIETHQRDMQTAFVPFSRGHRMCIGQHLAYANLFIILAALFRRFEMQVVDTVQERDVDIVRDYFVSKPSRKGKGVSIRIVQERAL